MSHIYYSGQWFTVTSEDLPEDLLQDLLNCGASGDASEAVDYVISTYIVEGDPKDCAAFLKSYGAWDAEELSDHAENLRRLVWLTGCDLRERGEAYFDQI